MVRVNVNELEAFDFDGSAVSENDVFACEAALLMI